MANYIYGAIELTGGTEGALDSINGDDLQDNDNAIVFTEDSVFLFRLDPVSAQPTSSPEIIAPLTNPGDKRWVLLKISPTGIGIDTASYTGLLSGVDGDLNSVAAVLDAMFSSEDFDISNGVASLKDGFFKSIVTDSGTVTPTSNQLTINGDTRISVTESGGVLKFELKNLITKTKSGVYTILATDDIIIGDTAGGNFTLTMPLASEKDVVRIIKKSNSNILTIERDGSDTLEGNQAVTMTDEYETITFISDGVNTWVRDSSDTEAAVDSLTSQVGTLSSTQTTNDNNAFYKDGSKDMAGNIIPDGNSTRNLGSAARSFSNAYADNFIGTASQAKYADLAERYTCADRKTNQGTVMMACKDGEFDVEPHDGNPMSACIGVVSTKPSYLMDKDLKKSVIVGIVGKVPVKVIGPINKGDSIIPSITPGCARAVSAPSELSFKIGVALESNSDREEKKVFCSIK